MKTLLLLPLIGLITSCADIDRHKNTPLLYANVCNTYVGDNVEGVNASVSIKYSVDGSNKIITDELVLLKDNTHCQKVVLNFPNAKEYTAKDGLSCQKGDLNWVYHPEDPMPIASVVDDAFKFNCKLVVNGLATYSRPIVDPAVKAAIELQKTEIVKNVSMGNSSFTSAAITYLDGGVSKSAPGRVNPASLKVEESSSGNILTVEFQYDISRTSVPDMTYILQEFQDWTNGETQKNKYGDCIEGKDCIYSDSSEGIKSVPSKKRKIPARQMSSGAKKA